MQQAIDELNKASNRLAKIEEDLTGIVGEDTYKALGTISARAQVRCAHGDIASAVYWIRGAVKQLEQKKKE